MSFLINPFRFGPAASYAANGVNFDGTNDYLTRGGALTGEAISKKGIIYFRFLFNDGDGVVQRLYEIASARFRVEKLSNNKIRITGKTGTTEKLKINTVATYTADATWHSFMASWDLATAGSGSIYVDDVKDYSETTFTDDTIDHTTTDTAVGANVDGSDPLNACIADFYVNLAEFLDFDTEANRRKFTDASDNPVDLGSDGSTPTGTAPIVFFHDVTSTWHTNDGAGGGFTENGALTDCGSDP